MGEPALALDFELLGRRRAVYTVDDSGAVRDCDDLDPEVAAELETMSGFSSDDGEPSDHNIFDMMVPGCPARAEGLGCEPAGPRGRCRHCGRM